MGKEKPILFIKSDDNATEFYKLLVKHVKYLKKYLNPEEHMYFDRFLHDF